MYVSNAGWVICAVTVKESSKKCDALTVHQVFSEIYFAENSAMVIAYFEQGTINSAYFEMGFGLSHSSINFPLDNVKLKAEQSTWG